MDVLHVRECVVQHALGSEAPVVSRFWAEFEAYEGEASSLNKPDQRENPEYFGRVWQHFEKHWGVACVHYLDRLVHRLSRAARREHNVLRRQELHHRNERLASRVEGMPNYP